MQSKFIVALTGIGAVTIIVVTCVLSGIDGYVVGGGIGVIGTIVGYAFGKKRNK